MKSTKREDRKENATAALFMNGRSQAVRLPQTFRFEGTRVKICKVKRGVLLEPLEEDKAFDAEEYFARLDLAKKELSALRSQGRNQPAMPVREFPF